MKNRIRQFDLFGRLGLLFPVVILAGMLWVNPTLAKVSLWKQIGRNWADVALLAIGMTPIILTGGIDLSVGSVVGLSAVAAGWLWKHLGWPAEAALAGGVATGLVAGAANGLLILGGINPLVVTLATLAVFRGLAYGLSGAERVDDFPAFVQDWWNADLLGIPYPVWLVIVVFVVMEVFVHHTWTGRMLYAVGDNARAARFAAVPVRGLTFSLYLVSGLLAGLVGAATVCEFASAPPDQGEGLELKAVACVVLGGVRITGGAGRLEGTLLGIITLAAILEGLVQVPARWRPVLTGVVLIAVAVLTEGLARWAATRETRPAGA